MSEAAQAVQRAVDELKQKENGRAKKMKKIKTKSGKTTSGGRMSTRKKAKPNSKRVTKDGAPVRALKSYRMIGAIPDDMRESSMARRVLTMLEKRQAATARELCDDSRGAISERTLRWYLAKFQRVKLVGRA